MYMKAGQCFFRFAQRKRCHLAKRKMTGGAEGAGLAGECEEVFIATVIIPDVGKSISENATI